MTMARLNAATAATSNVVDLGRTAAAADFIRCRALGHAWDDIEAERAPSFGHLMLLRCERCGTLRRDLVNRHGVLLPGGRSYIYPGGYKDEERVERSEYRRQLLTGMRGYVAPTPRRARARRRA